MRFGIALLLLSAAAMEGQTKPLVAQVERAPLSAELRGEILAAVELNAYQKAERLLLAEIERNPKSPELLTLAGDIFLADHEPLNAAIALKKADKLRPLAPDARFTLAMAYVAMKRRDWARPELTNLAQQQPANPLYVYWLGRLDYDDARYDDAAVKLRKAIALDPKFARAYDNLGLNLEASGHLEEASASYREAMRLNREQPAPSAWPALNLGTLELREGHLEEARQALEEALKLDNTSAQAHYRMGILCEKENRECAVPELRQAAKLDAGYSDPWWALARILRRDGHAAEADDALKNFQNLKAKTK